ncbi:XRE family transcriptional regulator [Actinobacteria bacterium YIM 96077]|uniref:XRE family transcriptional regulator n=1 Tax=Phytoactinopolyspora halophila TaxID=1981511 RepID=A0A329QHA7_9ACTN|nr:helix-turn-helix transcriptional regulator [Phytoactinopolyspora halophila]AYY13612.1 XRE family transcriptional regulator [Actinobacteria bacterium YIM 96077]RAW10722.1 XRE family transcriptional regulator [Phytoactinopolyspora halophila]
MDTSECIGEMIRRARVDHGYSQAELAAELARRSGKRTVTRDQVKRWESGKRIPRPRLRSWIGDVLGLPVDELTTAARQTRRIRGERAVPEPREPPEV